MLTIITEIKVIEKNVPKNEVNEQTLEDYKQDITEFIQSEIGEGSMFEITVIAEEETDNE